MKKNLRKYVVTIEFATEFGVFHTDYESMFSSSAEAFSVVESRIRSHYLKPLTIIFAIVYCPVSGSTTVFS